MGTIWLLLFLPLVQAGFYEKVEDNSINLSQIISETSEPSVVACIHRCRLIDIKAGTVFEKGVCKCIKRGEIDEANDVTVSGVVLQEKRIRGDTNVALRKPSNQSSTYKDCNTCAAELANDGVDSTTSVTGFDTKVGFWWQVDLLRTTTIKRIKILLHEWAFNTGKYVNVAIKIRSNDKSQWSVCKDIGAPKEPFVLTTCDIPLMVGRYVRISADKVLYLSEVKVIAIEE